VWGRESQVCTLTPNFTSGLKMWAYGLKKSPEMVIFGIHLNQKGFIPLHDFLENFAWVRESQDCTPMPNFTIVVLKMWPYSPKNCQKC